MKWGFDLRTAFGGAARPGKPGLAAVALVTIVACACPKKGGGGAGSGSGQGSGSSVVAPPAGGCEGLRPMVEAMYRAEAQAKEPKRVEEAVADNTAMVMAECAKAPDRFSACIAQAPRGTAEAQAWTAKDLETHCMPQLDDEGSEGDTLKK